MFCKDCHCTFAHEDARTSWGCYEDDYGISDGHHTTYLIYRCPSCGSEDVTDDYRSCSADCGEYTDGYGLCDSCKGYLLDNILETFHSNEEWYAYLDDKTRDDLEYSHDIACDEYGDYSLEELHSKKEVK